MITYRHNGLQPFSVTVKLDGKYVGQILRDSDGYYYKAGGRGGQEGDRFATVDAVKASIEGKPA